jgi:hypothetical protein
MIKSTRWGVLSGVALLVFMLPRVAATQERGNATQDGATPTTDNSSHTSDDDAPKSPNKRIFGIIPNNRTSDMKEPKALTPRDKFSLAAEDTFDWGAYMLAARGESR